MMFGGLNILMMLDFEFIKQMKGLFPVRTTNNMNDYMNLTIGHYCHVTPTTGHGHGHNTQTLSNNRNCC